MPGQFLHGVELIEIDGGVRPIKTVKSSVIGLIGTAPEAKDEDFPLNTPVPVIGSLTAAAKLGKKGTLYQAIQGIFEQVGAMVVVIRVAEDNESTKTISNIVGGADDKTGAYTGIKAFLDAKAVTQLEPRILIAPGFSHEKAVAAALVSAAERLRAVTILDGPNTKDVEAINFRKTIDSKRAYIVDPQVKIWDTLSNKEVAAPASSRVAGMIAKSDNERGFWWSPSNQPILGITGTARPIDFKLGDANCRANHLNGKEIATIIQEDGYRLWGNRTCSSDPKWAFLNVVRTADMIQDSIQRAHLWAVDRNITKTYIEDVVASVNAYLRTLTKIGAILGGKCWADPELNTPSELMAGKLYLDFDFTPPAPAEHITFRSHLVNGYFKELFKQ
ncbi:phage tail sheath subtilisin-like domain-containing protein [Lentisphaerota bacterium ZTH]|nr:phage tail sheath subtilisin-like domain-containing protein [Lentisphaerota bacterium]WET05831.1 phage tail sheath subtilisin-like domain-containing protein [Lentisphaerota bacterium ZTH]